MRSLLLRILIPASLVIFGLYYIYVTTERSPSNEDAPDQVSLRLQWVGQSQFAGFIVAKHLGYYGSNGLLVDIKPAGPDLKPHNTVASGSDDFGVGVSNQIILANSNGVPLIVLAQIFQDSANRYVVKAKNRVESLHKLVGEKVGLWLGGDEAEFIAMLASLDIDREKVQIIPQGYSVVPFLEDHYLMSQVTAYNELIQIEENLEDSELLQTFYPADFDSALPGDLLFTSSKMVEENPELVKRFVEASIKGWEYAVANPVESAQIVVDTYPELLFESELKMLNAVIPLVTKDLEGEPIGTIKIEDYEKAQNVLLVSGQMKEAINLKNILWLGSR